MSHIPSSSRAGQWSFWTTALAMAALCFYLGYIVSRNDFNAYITGYGAFFCLYLWTVFYQKSIPAKNLIALGIALRVLLLFSIPNLSDDYARFLWDGRLTIAGYHPFLHTPAYFIDHQILPPGITPALFQQLNSPNYFTVYPPVCQAVFALAAWVAPENNWVAVLVLKLFLLACELGTLRLLTVDHWPLTNDRWLLTIDRWGIAKKLGMLRPQRSMVNGQHSTVNGQQPTVNSRHPAVLFALNPLMILEVVGNCHFEGAMVFFLVAGIVALRRGRLVKPAIYWALATASKMLPLLFLPALWRWLGLRKGFLFNVVFGVATLLLFAPLIAVLPNIAESLDLYFREFQFNASIYYLVREIGYAKIGWDIGEFSGPRLALAAAAAVLLISLAAGREGQKSGRRLESTLLFALFAYMSCAAVVQPWYVCVPFALSLFTRWRFALLWTGLVGLSYSHYDGGLRQEHFGLIILEYALLWSFLLWECWHLLRKRRPESKV